MKRVMLWLGLVTLALTGLQQAEAATNDHFAARRREVERRRYTTPYVVKHPWGGPTTHSGWWTPYYVYPQHHGHGQHGHGSVGRRGRGDVHNYYFSPFNRVNIYHR